MVVKWPTLKVVSFFMHKSIEIGRQLQNVQLPAFQTRFFFLILHVSFGKVLIVNLSDEPYL